MTVCSVCVILLSSSLGNFTYRVIWGGRNPDQITNNILKASSSTIFLSVFMSLWPPVKTLREEVEGDSNLTNSLDKRPPSWVLCYVQLMKTVSYYRSSVSFQLGKRMVSSLENYINNDVEN